ncbi:MAG: GSCFA domain-containing protein [Flavobacteriaceae bacterium]|nr:GSCFA domain-containing protein [Flavobacteriaceae bacterium]|tara:strand:+ start:69703 stop:70656 length:954 start_codon:yes stop_codon:yes gene_type:complete
MKLQTKVDFEQPCENLIDYQSKVFSIGSCFSVNIGNKLSYFKFDILQNPFGILFHPLAIENFIGRSLSNRLYTLEDIQQLNGQFFSFDAHSEMNQLDKFILLEQLNKAVKRGNHQLQKASHILITLGTAWVYRHKTTNQIVANCHKVPQKHFDKELLSIEAIQQSLTKITAAIHAKNPKAELIFTVSPVRHIKNGVIENNRSKSNLISAVHNVVEHTKSLHYFPSYEIQMDELRDYRFYENDMIHPSNLAIEYIWAIFKSKWIDSKVFSTMTEIDSIQKGLAHKPFQENSEAHQKFKTKLSVKINRIQQQFPYINFE